MISFTTLETLRTQYDDATQTLYFPMKDVDGTVVGYKCLRKNIDTDDQPIVEYSMPDTNCFGVLSFDGGGGTKTTKEAVLVLNVFDLLALSSMQKLNCKFMRFN